MDPKVVPEGFYDLIARVVPGAALVIAAMLVVLTPSGALELLPSLAASQGSAWLVVPFLVFAYLVAVAMRPVWDVLASAARLLACLLAVLLGPMWDVMHAIVQKKPLHRFVERLRNVTQRRCTRRDIEDDLRVHRDFYRIRVEMSEKASGEEVARLVKIQAEMGLCEVLVAGLTLLGVADLDLLLWVDGPAHQAERLVLLAAIVLTAACFLAWRRSLERTYRDSIEQLSQLLSTRGKEESEK